MKSEIVPWSVERLGTFIIVLVIIGVFYFPFISSLIICYLLEWTKFLKINIALPDVGKLLMKGLIICENLNTKSQWTYPVSK